MEIAFTVRLSRAFKEVSVANFTATVTAAEVLGVPHFPKGDHLNSNLQFNQLDWMEEDDLLHNLPIFEERIGKEASWQNDQIFDK